MIPITFSTGIPQWAVMIGKCKEMERCVGLEIIEVVNAKQVMFMYER